MAAALPSNREATQANEREAMVLFGVVSEGGERGGTRQTLRTYRKGYHMPL